jgi:hypothetical protein
MIPPARHGDKLLPMLVPQVDEDGNELAGVRTPEIVAPMATYTGWNFRNPSIGAPDQLVSLLGSAVPFPRTAAERAAKKDPRRSVEERYPTKDAYTARSRNTVDKLIAGGYLLPDDAVPVMKRAEELWGGVTETTSR